MSKATPLPERTILDLADIQGGILRQYGNSFPYGRIFYFHVANPFKGRAFVEALRHKVTTALRWEDFLLIDPLVHTRPLRPKDIVLAQGAPIYPGEPRQPKPMVTFNLGFTYSGLDALGVPEATLRGMPAEFAAGMAARAAVLGDDRYIGQFDPIWTQSHGDTQVHIMLTLYAQMQGDGTVCPELEQETAWIEKLCADTTGGVTLLAGNGGDNAKWQDMAALLEQHDGSWHVSNKEHFGLSDGYGDPVFSGQFPPEAEAIRVQGGGKLLKDQTWAPIATGEFLLGYADEGQEVPGAAYPAGFSRNGTFMANRKLYEDVGAFQSYIADQSKRYAHIYNVPEDEASNTIKAKIVGRWDDGVPLMAAPTYADWQAFRERLKKARAAHDKKELAKIALEYTNFTYASDHAGTKCPVTAHFRRANPRDGLGPAFEDNGESASGSALVNRHRILRRGLTYGKYDPAAKPGTSEQGKMFFAICANLFRQFEFVQQQWIQYGLDFDAGSDTCPLVGNHPGLGDGKHVIPVDPAHGTVPFVLEQLPQFIEPRGGDYFFIPGMNALRMIARGIVDPT